ncbi:MAG: histidine triad nucleotide-binding protein [Mycobacteriales bacterium]
MPEDCLFCRIVSGDIPATIIREGPRTLALRDVTPQAPTHVLLIPREHHDTAADLVANAPDVLRELHEQASAVAESEGISVTGYRLVYNTGEQGGQSVNHVHLHLLGGRPMGWPPG